MNKKNALSLVAVLVAVVLALVSCSTVDVKAEPRTISVSGTGKVSVKPDMATFSVNISELKETTSEAQNATNEKIAKIQEVLLASGIREDDVSTESLNLYPEYRWGEGNERILVGQRCTQSLSVKVRKLEILGTLIDDLGAIDAIQIDSVFFDRQDKSEAYREARQAAAKSAGEKAAVYADSFSMILGKPLSVSEGAVESMPLVRNYATAKMTARAVSEKDAGTATPTGMLEVATTVSVVYEIH